jgi:hypothetical protein
VPPFSETSFKRLVRARARAAAGTAARRGASRRPAVTIVIRKDQRQAGDHKSTATDQHDRFIADAFSLLHASRASRCKRCRTSIRHRRRQHGRPSHYRNKCPLHFGVPFVNSITVYPLIQDPSIVTANRQPMRQKLCHNWHNDLRAFDDYRCDSEAYNRENPILDSALLGLVFAGQTTPIFRSVKPDLR